MVSATYIAATASKLATHTDFTSPSGFTETTPTYEYADSTVTSTVSTVYILRHTVRLVLLTLI